MKELTIEQKAKAYDEAVERGKSLLSGNQIGNAWIYKLLPELKDDDKEIRKELISMCQTLGKTEWIAWLEKQGEQKPADKVEPKFKVGDIIKHKEQRFTCKITAINITNAEYEVSECSGIHLPFDFQDAYELVEQKPIECSEDSLPEFESYLYLMFQKFRTKGVCTNGEIIDFVEEHAQKLKDILCHAWSEEDELNLSEALHHIRMYNLADKADKLDKWLKSLKTRVQLQPKEEWSEEDERQYRAAIAICNSLGHTDTADWLKSHKPHPIWKPSATDIIVLEGVIDGGINPVDYHATLHVVLEQLKKLRGE